ncbi:MAG: hypothetical protein R3321_10690, partial [Nitrososphaeraceae archaeon]|nr:hypothetical protein [Nitrososphaeraceae archaeon]
MRIFYLIITVISLIIICEKSFGQIDQELGLTGVRENFNKGYTLFSPENSNYSYLVNECGYLINSWEFSDEPNREAYLKT